MNCPPNVCPPGHEGGQAMYSGPGGQVGHPTASTDQMQEYHRQSNSQPPNVPQWSSHHTEQSPVSYSQQQQLRSRQKHHVSLPPVYYSTSGLSPTPSSAVPYLMNQGSSESVNMQIPPARAPQPAAGAVPFQMVPIQGSMQAQYTPQIQTAYPPPIQHLQQVPMQTMEPNVQSMQPNVQQGIQSSVQPVMQQGVQGIQQGVQSNIAPSAPSMRSSAQPHAQVPPSGQNLAPPVNTLAPPSAGAHGQQSSYVSSFHSPSHSPSSASSSPDNVPAVPPRMRRVQSWSQLKPMVIKVPKNRRAKPEGGFMSPLLALTTYLPSTYNICDPRFQYNQAKNPRRVLTEPHEGHLNNNYDNINSDYILYVNDILGADENRRYLALNLLGKGTFGQVVKCQNMATMEVVAVKVVKNKPAFLNQSLMEVSILEHIQQNVDKDDTHNLLRLKDKFMHKEHLCLVFELLSSNLYEVIKKNKFRGLGINVVRVFTQQLLDSLATLKSANLIHCDLKPENILLKRHDGLAIKVIDFGSACHERQTVYTYIQSRFYRSPEVILGLPYTSSIDMWSLGCIIAELFLGLPIFPGSSEYNQWSRIVESLGLPPAWMLDMGKNTANFMEKTPQGTWRLRTIEEQNQLFKADEKEGKKYFATPDIHETIMNYPLPRNNMSPAEVDEELKQRESLSDFIRGLLTYNPFERWTPQQAAMHPFISRQRHAVPVAPQTIPTQPTAAADLLEASRYQNAQVAQAYVQAHNHVQAQQKQQAQAQAQAQPLTQPQMPQQMPKPLHVSHAAPHVPLQSHFPQAQGVQSSHPAQPVMAPHYPPQQQFASGPQQRLMPQTVRGRSATIGQVSASVPAPIQQAAARVDPNDIIQGQNSPTCFPPDFYQGA